MRPDLLAFEAGPGSDHEFYYGKGSVSEALSSAIMSDLVLSDRDPELSRIFVSAIEYLELSEAAFESDYPAPEHYEYPGNDPRYPAGGWGLFAKAGPFGSYPDYSSFDAMTQTSAAFNEMCQALRQ